MRVQKRNGEFEEVKFDLITARIKPFCKNLDKNIDPVKISQKICNRIYDKIPTSQLDELTCEICISLSTQHPDYAKLASLIIVDNHHKNTYNNLYDVVNVLYSNKDKFGDKHPLISDDLNVFVKNNKEEIEKMIDYNRDFNFDYFGFKTLYKAYLLKVNKIVIERPQHMWMRVAIGIHCGNLEKVKETYDLLSNGFFTHATPTLFHSGTPRPQLSSCFLTGTEDSVDGIYKTITDCAKISKWAGGIGVHISNIRGKGAYIRKTSGTSSGILPMLKVYNDTARYINQSGRRPGSIAVYLEPWHLDVLEFLEAKKNNGSDEERARDLFYAMWIPDLFMKRVEEDGTWSLMCPDRSPGLADVHSEEFEKLYTTYEKNGNYVQQVKARDIWDAIISSQIETGTPYMLYKDAVNRKCNQKNIGTIRSSNLCCEITEFSDNNEISVCNLSSIALPKFVEETKVDFSDKSIKMYSMKNCIYCKMVKKLFEKYNLNYTEIFLDDKTIRDNNFQELSKKYEKDIKTVPQIIINDKLIGGYTEMWEEFRPSFNHNKLFEVTKVITRNLNKIIDINFYPVPETKVSNFKHRPIGIGVQGLADVFMMMKTPFDSNYARKLNKEIFETIYFAALTASYELSLKDGKYKTFDGSPLSKGLFQFDLWDEERNEKTELSGRWNWEELREKIKKDGVRNSLLVAPMPTASTAQILNNNECFEPYTYNLYTRRTIAGEFLVINKHLLKDLIDLNIWNEEIREKLMYYKGFVKNIPEIPDYLKDIYKTAWEIKQKSLIEMSADRGRFICQSQSFNVFVENPTYKLLTNIHLYGWKQGLKTGTYYIRSRAAVNSQNFTIDPNKEKEFSKENEEGCLYCN